MDAMGEQTCGHVHVLTLCTVFIAAALLTATASPAAAASLRGKVEGPDGQPRTATIRLLAGADDATAVRSVHGTDDEGTFEIPVPDNTPYRVRIESTGLVPVVLDNPSPDRLHVQRMHHGAVLEGRVVDVRSGDAIHDATVWICDRETSRFGFSACAEHRAEVSGRFRVTGVPAEAFHLGASSPKHGFHLLAVPANWKSDTFVRVELDGGAPLNGRVVNERGEPVADATIGRDEHRLPFGGETLPALDPPLITDEDGEFRHPGVKWHDRWTYRAQLEGWYGAPSEWIVPIQGSPETLELKLARPAALQFGLVAEDGAPVLADVRLVHQAGGITGGPRGRPDADGRYRFDGLPTRPLELMLTVEGHQPVDLGEVAFTAGGMIDLGDLRVSRGVRISGSVLNADSAAIDDGSIVLTYREPTRFRATVSTKDGRYEFEGVPSGVEVTLRADAEGYEPRFETLTLETDGTWDAILARLPAVRGRVVLPGGEPVKKFSANIHYQDQPSRSKQGDEFETEDGAFFLWPVQPEGTHTLQVSADGYRKAIVKDIVIVERQWVDVGEIELDLGHTVAGVATGPDGSPALGARVAVIPRITGTPDGSPAREIPPNGVADAEGRFEVTGLSAGFFAVDAQHPDFAPWTGEVQLVDEVQRDTVLIEFSEGGVVQGFTRDHSGAPVSGILVGFECPRHPGERTSMTDAQGFYRIDRLRQGQCRVWAFRDDGSPFGNPRLITVAEGRESRADFDLSTAIVVSGMVRVGGEPARYGHVTFRTGAGFAGSGVATAPIESGTGRYRAELTEPGGYRVHVVASGAQTLEQVVIPDQKSVERDFEVPLNWIMGRVVDQDGNPVSNASVSGSNARFDLAETMRTNSVTRSDGSFHLKHLQPGLYSITAVGDGFQRATSDPIEVRPGTRIEGLELVLAKSDLRVRGRFVDPAGNGITEGFVIAAPTGTRRLEFATYVTTRGDGTFEFDAPGRGPLDVTALSSDWAAVRITGFQPDGDSPLNLQAGFGGQVVIRVTDRNGAPREGFQIEVRATPEWLGSDTLAVLSNPPISGPDGVAYAPNLPEGTYRIAIPGGTSVMATVYDGQTAEIRLEVE
jgi:protocatechuate 3,4-dioxygenase beta subunit